VTGPTGCGKSTTLAAMINLVNQEKDGHIITIEDPIEFLHPHIRSTINQRELGSDTFSFPRALKAVLREDPNVILVGEMRDLETIAAALTLAETGHLVLSTLHTQDAAQTVDRIIDVFPPYQQEQIRVMLAATLKGVVSQVLLPRADGQGRVAAREVMVVTPALSALIREGKTHQIYSAIQTGGSLGMCTMEASLAQLYLAGMISEEDALSKANHPQEVRSLIGRRQQYSNR
jgi:twitching motility protein PilT